MKLETSLNIAQDHFYARPRFYIVSWMLELNWDARSHPSEYFFDLSYDSLLDETANVLSNPETLNEYADFTEDTLTNQLYRIESCINGATTLTSSRWIEWIAAVTKSIIIPLSRREIQGWRTSIINDPVGPNVSARINYNNIYVHPNISMLKHAVVVRESKRATRDVVARICKKFDTPVPEHFRVQD